MSESTFEDRLDSYILPPPGPQYYAVRRAIWLLPPQNKESPPRPLPQALERLQSIVSAPGAVSDDKLWKSSLESIWGGLSSGGVPKANIPMNIVVKIIHAAWMRDSTWPPGASAPEPDDALPDGGTDPALSIPPLVKKSGAVPTQENSPQLTSH